MPRIRTVKPEYFKHLKLFELEETTGLPLRVAYAALWTVADREGRFHWIPRQLKIDCLPYDDVDFSRVLDALSTREFVKKYTVDGVEYGYIPSFKEHQVINNRESQSKLPDPSNDEGLTREPRVNDASPTPAQGKGREGKGKEQVTTTTGADEKIEILVVKPQPEIPHSEGAHPVWDFEPSAPVKNEIQRFRIPDEFVKEQLSEFKTYRAGQSALASYDSKFLSQVLRNWKTQAHSWTPTPEANDDSSNKPSNRQSSGKRSSTIEQATQDNMRYLEQLEHEIAELERQEASGGYDENLAAANV